MEKYHFSPFPRDRHNRDGGKKVSLKKGLIVNRLKSLETKVSETNFFELTVSIKKWLTLFVYRPPKIATISKKFFEEISDSLDKAIKYCKNIVLEVYKT